MSASSPAIPKKHRKLPERPCVVPTASGGQCYRPALRDTDRCYSHTYGRPPGRPKERTGAEPLLTVAETAVALYWEPARVYEAVKRGVIPHVKNGRSIWIPRAAIQRLMNGQPEPASVG